MDTSEKSLLEPQLTNYLGKMDKSVLPLKIVSYNVHFGKKIDSLVSVFSENDNLKNADIILLQEVEDHVVEHNSRAKLLASSLGYHCLYAPAQIRKQKGTHGLAILSKLPIKSFKVIKLAQYKLLFRPRARIALVAELEVENKLLLICNIHLDLPLSVKDRVNQIEPVLKNIQAMKSDGIIFAGDLNTAPVHWVKRGIPVFYSNQRKVVRNHLIEQGFESASHYRGYTHVSPLGRLHLDGIYSRGLAIVDYGVENQVEASDHRPLWMKFKI